MSASSLELKIIEILRLAPIYILKEKHLEELPDDFKPHKWTDEKEFAQETANCCREFLDFLLEREGMESLEEMDTINE